MKIASWAVLMLSILLVGVWPTSAQNSVTGGGDFRSATWGMSQLEVEASESVAPFQRDENIVIYRAESQGHQADVVYFFHEAKLIMGFVHLRIEHDDLDDYFADYEDVKSKLGNKFGEPDAENWQMSLPELEDDREAWADALGFGLIKVEAGWIQPNTGVALRLSGGGFSANLMITHFDRAQMSAGRQVFKGYFAQKVGVPNKYFRK